jgi:hypothetical protein
MMINRNIPAILLVAVCLLWQTKESVCQAQKTTHKDSTTYGVEMLTSFATGDYTPFWIASNRYGAVPLQEGGGYLRADATHRHRWNDNFYCSAGMDMLLSAPRHTNAYLQQLYAEAGYKFLRMSIGSKEQYISLWDKNLSSGDMIESANARPVPEVNISIPHFILIPYTKGFLQLKADFGIGRSLDTDYLDATLRPTENGYVQNLLWHHKSVFFKIADTQGQSPFFAVLGIRHISQWGGASTVEKYGKQPDSFLDFIRVFAGQSGGADASLSDQINVLGSHHVAYDIQLGFRQTEWEVQAYHQHLAYDKSGMELKNGIDGLWGIRLDIPRFPILQKIVVEYINTRDQSGPFHYITFDHEAHPGMGGGRDDYYNNEIYTSGFSYFNRSTGSPLLPSPEYNTTGEAGFLNNRILDWHIGLEGAFSPQLSYRALGTLMNGWGTTYRPFLHKKEGCSFLIEMRYSPAGLSGWTVSGAVAGDTGDMLGKETLGAFMSISKRGFSFR